MNNSEQDTAIVVSPGIYLHYKGNLYEVIASVRHSETREELTLYRALYGDYGLWVRPTAMFVEVVTVEGAPQLRFERVGETTGA